MQLVAVSVLTSVINAARELRLQLLCDARLRDASEGAGLTCVLALVAPVRVGRRSHRQRLVACNGAAARREIRLHGVLAPHLAQSVAAHSNPWRPWQSVAHRGNQWQSSLGSSLHRAALFTGQLSSLGGSLHRAALFTAPGSTTSGRSYQPARNCLKAPRRARTPT